MQPIQISIWDGYVLGGGVGCSINFPIKIATEKTLFGMPEAKIGFFCDVGASHFLGKLPHGVGLYVALTSSFVKGEDTVKMGFATHFVKQENLAKLEEALSGEIREESTLEDVQNIVKAFESPVSETPYTDFAQIKHYFGGQKTVWDIYKKLREDKTHEAFAQKTLEAMASVCTVSKAVIVQNIVSGRGLSLLGQFKQDLGLAAR